MAAAAVSCSLLSRGCLNLQAARAQPAVASSSGSESSGRSLLVWDPLLSSSALRTSSSYLSSPSSIVSNWRSTHRRRNLRLTSPRASSRDDGKLEQVPEVERADRDEEVDVVKVSGTATDSLINLFTSAAKPAVVAAMVALLLSQPTDDAFAASSGGRMGGRVFSKPSAPSRSYSGGGGGGGGAGRSYSGGGMYSAPPIYGSPYGFSPFGYSPFYGGGYGGGFLGPSIGFGGGGTIVLAMIAFATLRTVLGFIKDRFGGGEQEDDRFDDE